LETFAFTLPAFRDLAPGWSARQFGNFRAGAFLSHAPGRSAHAGVEVGAGAFRVTRLGGALGNFLAGAFLGQCSHGVLGNCRAGAFLGHAAWRSGRQFTAGAFPAQCQSGALDNFLAVAFLGYAPGCSVRRFFGGCFSGPVSGRSARQFLRRGFSESRAWAERSAIFRQVLFRATGRAERPAILGRALLWVTHLGIALGNFVAGASLGLCPRGAIGTFRAGAFLGHAPGRTARLLSGRRFSGRVLVRSAGQLTGRCFSGPVPGRSARRHLHRRFPESRVWAECSAISRQKLFRTSAGAARPTIFWQALFWVRRLDGALGNFPAGAFPGQCPRGCFSKSRA